MQEAGAGGTHAGAGSQRGQREGRERSLGRQGRDWREAEVAGKPRGRKPEDKLHESREGGSQRTGYMKAEREEARVDGQ